MKILKLTIRNIGLIADTAITLNKPLILFYGDIMQGKTTILNAVKWGFGGAFPADIIRHGQDEASVTMAFEGGSISREWYRGQDGATKAREIVFVRDGKPVKRPVDEIRKYLNPFLLDQDHLRKMGEAERKAYFTQLFGVDTSALDAEAMQCEIEARDLRATVKGYGVIDLTAVQPIDMAPLQQTRAEIREHHATATAVAVAQNETIDHHNETVTRGEARLEAVTAEIAELEQRLVALQASRGHINSWLLDHPRLERVEAPPAPDTAALEARISEAAATNVRAEQARKNVERAAAKKVDEKTLHTLETRQRQVKQEKAAKLAQISETCGIKDLAFNEAGEFLYQGTTAGMLSGSQIMRLSSELSALYPEGLGLDLIDRGESLGKSIFTFVDRAQKEKKTILATIVGEKPAKVPENIGVFVVERGTVTETAP